LVTPSVILAREWQRMLVVADRDFGELIFHQGLAHTDVSFFQLPGAPLATKIERPPIMLHDSW